MDERTLRALVDAGAVKQVRLRICWCRTARIHSPGPGAISSCAGAIRLRTSADTEYLLKNGFCQRLPQLLKIDTNTESRPVGYKPCIVVAFAPPEKLSANRLFSIPFQGKSTWPGP